MTDAMNSRTPTTRRDALVAISLGLALATGCTSVPRPDTARGQAPATESEQPKKDDEPADKKEEKKNGKENGEKPETPPKTLLEWAVGPKDEKKDGNGGEEEEPIVTDRPDFTEATRTVGRGRVQLEAGYTYTRDRSAGAANVTRTYPDALLRIGLFADWFELRLGQTFVSGRGVTFGVLGERFTGPDDLYVGTKLALTEQKVYLPETALILQATLPTGARVITANQVLPGFNFVFGWDVIKDCLYVGGGLQANRVADDTGHYYVEFADSITVNYQLTRQLGAFTEWFAFFPSGAQSPGLPARHNFDCGLTYQVTPDFQVDVFVGYGISDHADDFFAGTGFAVRY
jgi:Putative MetA-pathway of phenol degradation